MELPQKLGAIILPGVYLFPSNFLPLYIFEEKYRAMLAHSLSTTRMFAVLGASVVEGQQKKCYGGVGMIRYCVQNPDGTSHLVLQGLRRVKFEKCPESAEFPIGAIEAIVAESESNEESEIAMQSLIKTIEAISKEGVKINQEVLDFFRNVKDLETLIDILAGSMIGDCDTKKMLLVETCLLTRAKIAREAILKLPPDELLSS